LIEETLLRRLAEKRNKLAPESVVLPRGPERSKTSVYLDPLIWRAFGEDCRKVGQSTCGVLEPFMYAFSVAVRKGEYQMPRPITVYLNVERRVERIHRRGHEIEVERREVHGSPLSCAWCGDPPIASVGLKFSGADKVRSCPFLCSKCLEYAHRRFLTKYWRDLK